MRLLYYHVEAGWPKPGPLEMGKSGERRAGLGALYWVATRIESLEGLRAGAALAVLAGHALDYAGIRHDGARALAFGADVFFVLSGYIVALSAERAGSVGEFLRKRAWRILPLYYMATLLEWGRLWGQVDGMRAWRSLLFLPQDPGPLVLVGWTLNFEVGFYLWLAVVIGARPRAFREMAALGPAVAALVNPIWLLFAAGCLLRPLPGWCLVLGAGWWAAQIPWGIGDIWDCTLTVLGRNSAERLLHWGLPAVLLVGGAAGQMQRAMPGWVLYLGRESYAIYLCQYHGLVVAAQVAALAGYPRAMWLGLGALGYSLCFAWLASMVNTYGARIELSLRRAARLRA